MKRATKILVLSLLVLAAAAVGGAGDSGNCRGTGPAAGSSQGRVKIIVLTQDQQAEIDRLTRFLDAINKALLVYYEPPLMLNNSKRYNTPETRAGTDDISLPPPL
jgi:hypothetical protein